MDGHHVSSGIGIRVADELTEPAAGDRGVLLVPLADVRRELISELLQTLDPFVDGREVLMREREHVRARRLARSGELENLTDLIEREAKPLRLADELKLLERGIRVSAVAG